MISKIKLLLLKSWKRKIEKELSKIQKSQEDKLIFLKDKLIEEMKNAGFNIVNGNMEHINIWTESEHFTSHIECCNERIGAKYKESGEYVKW